MTDVKHALSGDSSSVGRVASRPRSPLKELGNLRPDVVALLERGRDLVDAGWTREVYARTTRGVEVDPLSLRARRFCAVGALVRADWELNGEPWEEAELPVAYDGSPGFVTALALLSTAAQLAIVHPRERSALNRDRIWAKAALRSSPRGLLDVANDRGPHGKREIISAYDLAIVLASALPGSQAAD
jgi:hypothetical protein